MADIISEIITRRGCRLVLLQGGGRIRVPTPLFRLFPLNPGEAIDLSAYQGKISGVEKRHALEQAARLLESRDRSREELYSRLLECGYSAQASEEACDRLTAAGYLDDGRYAAALVRRLGRQYGEIRQRQVLRRKGIAQEMIEAVLATGDAEEQLAAAVRLAEKALKNKAGEPAALYRRAYFVLARRGFPPDMVRKALALANSDHQAGTEDA